MPTAGTTSGWSPQVAIDPEGNIVTVMGVNATGGQWFSIIRYDENGSQVGGAYTSATNPIGVAAIATDLLVQPTGNVVVALQLGTGTTRNIALARVLADLSGLDPTFGTAGVLQIPGTEAITTTDFMRIASGPLNYIYGTCRYPINLRPTIFWVDNIGQLINVFTNNTYTGDLSAIQVQPDGSILTAGGNASTNLINIIRWLSNGSLDLTWGVGGRVMYTPFSTGGVSNVVLSLMNNGNILLNWSNGSGQGIFGKIFTPTGNNIAAYGENGTLTCADVGALRGVVLFRDNSALVFGNGPTQSIGVGPTGVVGSPYGPTVPTGFGNGVPIVLNGSNSNNGKAYLVGRSTTTHNIVIYRMNTGKTIAETTATMQPQYPPGPIDVPILCESVSLIALSLTPVGNPPGGFGYIWTPLTNDPANMNFIHQIAINVTGFWTLKLVSWYSNRKMASSFEVTFEVVICLHGSSKVLMADGSTKNLRDVEGGDLVRAADGKEAKVVERVRCWRNPIEKDDPHRCAIFEPDSLGEGVPSERLLVDVGHPIGRLSEFSELGSGGLLPAIQFAEGLGEGQARVVSWSEAEDYLPDAWWRYDLILEEGTCGAYIVNGGVVAKARNSVLDPGYHHDEDLLLLEANH